MSASSALRGYRTQFLYSLHKILDTLDNGFSYKPEGNEDLDVYNEQGQLIEAIQVKNLKSGVFLSHILSRDKTSFIRRSLELISKNKSLRSILVSFTSFSPEICDVIKGNNLAREKLLMKDYNLPMEHWQHLKNHLSLVQVSEEILYSECLSKLKSRFAPINPEVTLHLLHYWLSLCAETGALMTKASIFKKIEEADKYIKERASLNVTYGTYLKPLHQSETALSDVSRLSNEYYNGISARLEHIQAGLDVIREEPLEQLLEGFKTNNIVILHGASGQGKSSMAYRYIHTYRSSELVYELVLQDDYTITSQVIRSVQSITQGLNMPVLFLINVIPATVHWIRIVREFAAVANINFLITVREDDWNRAIATGIDFLHSDVELGLLKEEAKPIYLQLTQQIGNNPYSNFEEAWIDFGGKGPLLEFVYLITQGDNLKNRLRQQVIQIANESSSDEQIRLLRLIALIDSLNCRATIDKLRKIPNLLFILQKLENEYLVKLSLGGQHITGLHPVRSKLLKEILFDEVIERRSDYLLSALEVTEGHDWFYFLVQIFYEGLLDLNTFFGGLVSLSIDWIRFTSVVKALLWKGIYNYVATNRSVFDESYSEFSAAWQLLMNIYFTPKIDISAVTKLISKERLEVVENLKKKLTSKENIFNHATRFLGECAFPTSSPQENKEVIAYGEFLFWQANITGIKQQKVPFQATEFEGRELSLSAITNLLFGLSIHLKDAELSRLQQVFIFQLRKQYLIAHLELSEDEVKAHFVFPYEDERVNFDKIKPYDVSIEIANLLSRALPNKKYYATEGYGHNLKIVELPYDDSKKRIHREHLSPDELVFLSSTTLNLFDYTKRPIDWIDFRKGIIAWESQVEEYFFRLEEALQAYFKHNSYTELGQLVDDYNENPISYLLTLPQNISDRFGIYANARSAKKQTALNLDQTKTELFYSRYEVMLKSYRDFQTSIENFQRQSKEVIYRTLKNKIDGKSETDEQTVRLSKYNLFEAIKGFRVCRQHQSLLFEKTLEKDGPITLIILYKMAFAWNGFLNGMPVRGSISNQTSVYFKEIEEKFEKRLRQRLKKIKGIKISLQKDEITGNRPIILLETKDVIGYLTALPEVYTAIREAIGSPENLGLKKLLLDQQYTFFYVLPLIDGLTVNSSWHEYSLVALTKYEYFQLPLFQAGVKPIPLDVADGLKFYDWNALLPRMREARELIENLVKLKLTVEHLMDVYKIETLPLDDLGNKLLKEYGELKSKKVEEYLQRSWDYLTSLMGHFHNDTEDEEDELRQELWMRISGIQVNILPNDNEGSSTFKAEVSTPVMEAWWPRLTICIEEASWLYFIICQLEIRVYSGY